MSSTLPANFNSMVDPAILEQRRVYINGQVDVLKDKLRQDLDSLMRDTLSNLPTDLKQMKMRDFLLLAALPYQPVDRERRMTRSMTRQSSVTANSRESIPSVPSTPSLHPLLPETPAVLRQAIRLAKAKEAGDFKRPVRITRSSIRRTSAIVDQSSRGEHVTGGTIGVDNKKNQKDCNTTKPDNQDSSIVSLELSDGKVVDVDLSASPKAMLQGLGAEAVREVRNKMRAYAAQLRMFFKKLNF